MRGKMSSAPAVQSVAACACSLRWSLGGSKHSLSDEGLTSLRSSTSRRPSVATLFYISTKI